MSNIPSVNQKIQVEPTQYRAPVSESLLQTIGGSVNYALDEVATNAASISSVSGTLSALTTQLNSSAEAFKQTGTIDSGVLQLGDNSVHAENVLIERNTISVTAGTGEWWWFYFSSDRVDTTRATSYIKITFANEPDFGTTILFNGAVEDAVGFARPFFLPPGTGVFTIYVDLYSSATPIISATRNRWNYRAQGRRFDPTSFIIP